MATAPGERVWEFWRGIRFDARRLRSFMASPLQEVGDHGFMIVSAHTAAAVQRWLVI